MIRCLLTRFRSSSLDHTRNGQFDPACSLPPFPRETPAGDAPRSRAFYSNAKAPPSQSGADASPPSLTHPAAPIPSGVADRARPADRQNATPPLVPPAVGRTPLSAAWALSQRRAAGIPLDAWEFD